MRGHARASANFALVKYWGKRDAALNLPARGSLSVTVDALYTETTVIFEPDLAADCLSVDGRPRPGAATLRASRVLDLIRAAAGASLRARVLSKNSFPYGAGLASSASSMAALSLAAARALGLDLSLERLSVIARHGSGSAARSLHGGYVLWREGTRADGEDAHGSQLHPPEHWPLRVLVALVDAGEKDTSSSQGMQETARSSPLYAGWLDSVNPDLEAAQLALAARDLAALGEVMERSCLTMHAAMMSARPGLLYWRAATVALIHRVRALRAEGLGVYFTIDAGPHVKALCAPKDEAAVRAALEATPGVTRVIACGVGGHAR
ncbi:diphosphomevalonate decarboxylase [Myxococcota bacterium]|nr:diphosphomevalonate decarboxylase [Myxococcota bacterium]